MILRPVTPASAEGPPWLKLARRVDVQRGVRIPPRAQHARPQRGADVLDNLLLGGLRGVLGRDDHGRDFLRLVVLVEDRNLGLAVGAEKADLAALAIVGQPLGEPVSEQNRERHHLFRLVGGVAEHDALVAGALVAALARCGGHALRDLGGLLRNDRDELERRIAEGLGDIRIADFLHRQADDPLVVQLRVRRDLPGNDHRVALAQRLARDAALRVLLEAGVEDGVRDVIADLVGMPLGHRL